MEAVENALRAGDRLDRYELLCPIASGGMATVWLARLRGKRGFEKLFAIKTIRTELVEDPRFQEMFLDEARITSGIQHPNVAQILDLGEQRDVLFIVMEWVDGDSLAKIRKLVVKAGGSVPIGPALRILADACAGLHAAHELRDDAGNPLGIVHRDVSPQNILVSTAGAVKVIDFGIAKAQNRRQGETRTGIVKGKLQYMAPEQVKKGRDVDRRADVWALGICLHELVAGRLPNEGDDDVEVIRKLLADEAPQCAEGLPEAVARVLAQSIAINPDDRFSTAAAMQRALENAMKDIGESATSEDVAAFVRSALPELAERRRAFVGQAISQARDRSEPGSEPREEVAFAPTIVSDRSSGARSAEDARAIALTKRKSGGRIALRRGNAESRPVDDATEEPLEIPKRSRLGYWVLLFLVIGGGVASALRWGPGPRGAKTQSTAPRDPSTASQGPGVPAQPIAASVSPSTSPHVEPATAAPSTVHVSPRWAAEPVEPHPSASAAPISDAGSAAARDAEPVADDAGLALAGAAAGASATAAPAVAAPAVTAPAVSDASVVPLAPGIEDDPNNPYSSGPSAAPIDP